MSRVAQPATAINPPSEPPAASQRVAAVCRNRCGWNRSIPASRDRYFSAACSPSYEKPFTPVADPQFWAIGAKVSAPKPHVPIDRRGSLRTEGDDASFAPLASPHSGDASGQIDVGHFQTDDFASTHPGFCHQSHDGLVAALTESLTGARLDSRLQLSIGQRVGDLGVELGRFDAQ